MTAIPQIILLTALLASEPDGSFVIYKEGDEGLQKSAMGVKPFTSHDYYDIFNEHFIINREKEKYKTGATCLYCHLW